VTRPFGRRLRPLVAVVCFAPLMAEGVATALDGVAETRLLPADLADLTPLLRTLAPDAIVVDRECRAARAHAEQSDVPLFVVPVEPNGVEVPSPERLRALVVGSLLVGQVRA
jgi:hypothetical protein